LSTHSDDSTSTAPSYNFADFVSHSDPGFALHGTGRLLRTGIAGQDAPRIVGGDGPWLFLADGQRVIDATNTPAPLGHRHPRIVEAVRRAAGEAPCLDEGWATVSRETAAETLLGTAFAGEDWVGAVRFALTGSEANDLALSLCQALTGRVPLVTRERAYHGMVGLARDVTVQPQWHGGISDTTTDIRPVPRATEVRVLPFPTSRLGQGLQLTSGEAESILSHADDKLDQAAAVIVDYTQGGCYGAPSYQDVLARKARAAGVLWIADEVVTAFGKTGGGHWFNFQRGRERPDIVTLGKPLGGGLLPVAAVVVSNDVLEQIGDGSWQTYSALRSNELGAAAATEVIRVIEEEDLIRRADELHDVILPYMSKLADHPAVGRIDGHGLHWWIEIGDEDWRTWTGVAESPDVTEAVVKRTLEAGAMVATSAERNVILITLPLIIRHEQVASLCEAVDEGLKAVEI
jgi:4-aminobutyrate aminotransferase-like enzyme